MENSQALLQQLRSNIQTVFVGQDNVVDQVLIALLANGHVLIEGVPGLGKTLLVRCLAASINGEYKRVQFTPDLMPADVTGHAMYDMKTEKFHIRRGPAFTNFLLADEINRAPAKTQSSLLEVMQEGQVTIEGKSIATPKPFMVLATQNPLDHEGTYPLPEAELDRFIIKIDIHYPSLENEVALTRLATQSSKGNLAIDAVINTEQLIALQKNCQAMTVDEKLYDYAVRLVQATRNHPSLQAGAGPRASIALIQCAKAHAFLNGNDFILPDDIKAVAKSVLRHRLQLSPDMEIEGIEADTLIEQILNSISAPHQ